MNLKTATGWALAEKPEKVEPPPSELIDAPTLARKWNVPTSWIRDHTRSRTKREDRIPHIRLGRYVRFKWPSRELDEWLARHQY